MGLLLGLEISSQWKVTDKLYQTQPLSSCDNVLLVDPFEYLLLDKDGWEVRSCRGSQSYSRGSASEVDASSVVLPSTSAASRTSKSLTD